MFRPLAIIEFDAASSAELRTTFEAAGFRTDCFADGSAALRTLRQRAFSLAILDLDPNGDDDPLAVCQEVSRIVPVVTVTSDPDEERCVAALRAGADDCVCRPVTDRELVARVRNVLRRTSEDETSTHPDTLSISIAEMRVRNGGAVHALSRGETEVLALLVERAPAPLTAAQLAELLHTPRGTIESRIKSLRRKLGPGRLVSRGGFGYQLDPE